MCPSRTAQNNSHNPHRKPCHPRNSRLSKLRLPRHHKRTMLKATRKRAVAARPGARVRHSAWEFYKLLTSVSDSPLPDARIPNGAPTVGPSGRPNSWGGANWANGPARSAVSGLGKPPPGRDPQSRNRSRDYIKQCADLSSSRFLVHLSVSPDASKKSHTSPPRKP